MRNILATMAALLAIVAAIPYLIDILKRRTKPNIVSWLTWTILLAIATAAAFAAHQTRSALLTTGDLIGTGLTLILGLKYGIAKMTWLDAFCQIGAVAGLVLWFVFNSPSIAIISAVIIDLLASIPTLNHSWHTPAEETWQTFAIITIGAVLTLISLQTYNTASLTFPVYLLLINLAFTLTVVYRRKKLGLSLTR